MHTQAQGQLSLQAEAARAEAVSQNVTGAGPLKFCLLLKSVVFVLSQDNGWEALRILNEDSIMRF